MHPRSSPPISLFVRAGADGANSPRCWWPPIYPAGMPQTVREQAQAAHNNIAPPLLRIILHAIPCTHNNAPCMRPYIPRIPPTDNAHKSAPALLLLSPILRINSTRNTHTQPMLHGIIYAPHIPPHKASRRAPHTPQPVRPTPATHRQTSASTAHVIPLQPLRAFLLVILRAMQRETPTRHTLTGSQPMLTRCAGYPQPIHSASQTGTARSAATDRTQPIRPTQPVQPMPPLCQLRQDSPQLLRLIRNRPRRLGTVSQLFCRMFPPGLLPIPARFAPRRAADIARANA